ncbi:MAG: arylmalonate decarboxylase [Gammaproteobacteria bacterium]|nr:arylmalonate decarboxylase [Gammaproteobacteria bacterium]
MAVSAPAFQSKSWAVRFDRGRVWRSRIGFVLIATERNIEEEMPLMAPEGVGVHFTRVVMGREVNVENLAAQLDALADAAALIMPEDRVDVVCYACTSGTVVMGEENVIAQLQRGAPNSKATTLLTGVITGLRAVGARKIVVGTPYLDEINVAEEKYLRNCGFDVLDIQGMNLRFDEEMVRVAPDFLLEFAQAIDRPDADAVFISCGALRTIEVIDQIEQALGKPAISSNQAMMWHCLRLAGIDDKVPGYGTLFRDH